MKENQKSLIYIAKKFGLHNVAEVCPLEDGLINKTFLVNSADGEFVLQGVHPIFPPAVTEDIHQLTQRLHGKGLKTPLLQKTQNGDLLYEYDDIFWRTMTLIEGKTYHVANTDLAYKAGRLVGEFHAVIYDWDYVFMHTPKSWHNTEHYMQRLKKARTNSGYKTAAEHIEGLADNILAWYADLQGDLAVADKTGVVHGDLKISNVRFSSDGEQAQCLLDLDLVHRGNLFDDLGDAVRSWCNPKGEDSSHAYFDTDIFFSMIEGYGRGAKNAVESNFVEHVFNAAMRITLELASRFLTDAYQQKYFQLESNKYKNLFEQNHAKALSQIALFKDMKQKRKEVMYRL